MTIAWRIQIAELAHRFFGLARNQQWAELAGAPYEKGVIHPWTVAHFMTFLGKVGNTTGNLADVVRVLGALEHAGLLLAQGFDYQKAVGGQTYLANGGPVLQRQDGGKLWLAEALGAELIIPFYCSATVQITGYATEADAAAETDERWGTGLIVDRAHILTNRHVAEGVRYGMQVVQQVPTPAGYRSCRVRAHAQLDVAVIELELADDADGLQPLAGMVFRDPNWADETFVFGFPRVPMTAEMAITVQRGEVVNPSTPSMPSREPVFLYSAIARPGNSGGPIVAGDGRVIGLVVEDSSEVQTNNGAPVSAPFYRGLPTSEVVRALTDLGFPNLAKVESWA